MPVNWEALVAEAIRRRKAERMTQKEHAALASVSIPTMLSFERGEQTLSLGKAFDILRVVGLIEEGGGKGSQENFVQVAVERWRELVRPLPSDSPARFQHGWYRLDYALEGDLKALEPYQLLPMMREQKLNNTGWPMFVAMTRDEFEPYERDGVLECWLKPAEGGLERRLNDPAHCDFWQASPSGRFVLLRGYQEDGADTFEPGRVFDTTLPIWRIAEGLLHSSRMARVLVKPGKSPVHVKFSILYTGLAGRVLRSWANPLADLFIEGGAARSDEAMLQTESAAGDIEGSLTELVYPMVVSLFDRFGVTGLSKDRVEAEIRRFEKSGMVG